LLDQAVEESRKILAAHKVTIRPEASAGTAHDEPAHGDEPGQSDRPALSDEPAWFDRICWAGFLRHLLENVASYTPPGSRVTLISERSDERLDFYVEDNGPGIDAQDLPLIFEKFLSGQARKQPAQRVWHGPRHYARDPCRAWRRNRSIKRSRQRSQVSFLGAADRERTKPQSLTAIADAEQLTFARSV